MIVRHGFKLSSSSIWSENLISFSKIGSSIPITSFGNLLYLAAYEGFKTKGILGIFSNMLSTTSAGITSTVIFAFLVSIIFKSKD